LMMVDLVIILIYYTGLVRIVRKKLK
jgi:hypothetical protein